MSKKDGYIIQINKSYKQWWEKRYYEKKLDRAYLCWIVGISFVLSVLAWLLQGNIAILLRGILGHDMIDYMLDETGFLGSAVLTLSTILGALTVFFYGSLVYKNFGFSNRKIIAYTYGSIFFPCVLAINVIIVSEMMIAYYNKAFSAFYFFGIYSCLLQGFYMVCSVLSTTQSRCSDVLIGIEKKQFEKLKKVWNGKFYEEMYAGEQERSRNEIVVHMDSILKGDETIQERLEMMRNILCIPFSESENMYTDENNRDIWATYNFYYQNFYSVAAYLKKNPEDAQKTYSVLYEVIAKMQQYVTKNRKLLKGRFLTCLAAMFITLIPTGLEDIFQFFAYIVNHIVKELELRECVPLLYLKFLAVLWVRGQIDLENHDIQIECEKLMKSVSGYCVDHTENVEDDLFCIIMACGASGTGTNANGNDSLICRVQEAFAPESELELLCYLHQILLQKRKRK